VAVAITRLSTVNGVPLSPMMVTSRSARSSCAAARRLVSACSLSAARNGSITSCASLPRRSATLAMTRPFTSRSSVVTITTTVSRGLISAMDCGTVMFLVFGRISTSELCNSRNTTSMVNMSMNGTSAMWLPPCERWRCFLMR
jgi:hypothetical protein